MSDFKEKKYQLIIKKTPNTYTQCQEQKKAKRPGK